MEPVVACAPSTPIVAPPLRVTDESVRDVLQRAAEGGECVLCIVFIDKQDQQEALNIQSYPELNEKSPIKHMELLLREGKDLLDSTFHKKLADEFNQAPGRVESKAIQMHQVQRWFLSRLKVHKTEDAISPSSSKEMSPDGEESLTIGAPPQNSDKLEETGEKVSEEVEMEFEARSRRDLAWYDVSTFLAHRVLSSGEVEVRVRFDGFGSEEDEWVNVRKAVRERSIPLESTECWKVKEGDVVLCFREKNEAAKYFDAHVLEIERKMHDIRGCRCIFLVRYSHDQTEERVHLSRLCCRP